MLFPVAEQGRARQGGVVPGSFICTGNFMETVVSGPNITYCVLVMQSVAW